MARHKKTATAEPTQTERLSEGAATEHMLDSGIRPTAPTGAAPDDDGARPFQRASAYEVAQQQLDEVAAFMGLDDDLAAYLRTPQRGLIVHFPVRMDTYSMHKGYSAPAVITGKPVSIGGTAGREYATGLGVTYVTRAVLQQRMGRGLEDARVAIQGFGNVGSWTARSMHERGACIAAVSDLNGGIYNRHGLDMRLLIRHVQDNGTVMGFPGADEITNEDLLAMDVDVLVPAALEGQITRDNAALVRAKVIAEGANGPATPEADAILRDNGSFIIPDIICNAGGVAVSYFEWVQGLQSYFWNESEVRRQMENTLLSNLEAVNAIMTRRECSMRMAAYIIAIDRIVEAIRVRGFYPWPGRCSALADRGLHSADGRVKTHDRR